MSDGLIYIAGGCDGAQNCFPNANVGGALTCACSTITNNLVAYNPRTDTYTVKPPMPEARYRHVTCALGNNIFVFGGKTLLPSAVGAWKSSSSSSNGECSYQPLQNGISNCSEWMAGMLNDSPGARTAVFVRAPPPPFLSPTLPVPS
jgi:hypothetical protein